MSPAWDGARAARGPSHRRAVAASSDTAEPAVIVAGPVIVLVARGHARLVGAAALGVLEEARAGAGLAEETVVGHVGVCEAARVLGAADLAVGEAGVVEP